MVKEGSVGGNTNNCESVPLRGDGGAVILNWSFRVFLYFTATRRVPVLRLA